MGRWGTVWKNKSLEPDIDRLDGCAICGFSGNPDEITDTELSYTNYTTTGTTWRDPDASNQDLVPDSYGGISRRNCAFCGGAMPISGRPGDLKKGW